MSKDIFYCIYFAIQLRIYFRFSTFNLDFFVKLILIEFRQCLNVLRIIFWAYYIDKNFVVKTILLINLVIKMFSFLFILICIAIKTSIMLLLQRRKHIQLYRCIRRAYYYIDSKQSLFSLHKILLLTRAFLSSFNQ